MDMYRHFYPPIPDPEARQSFVPLSHAHQTVNVQDPNPRDLDTFLDSSLSTLLFLPGLHNHARKVANDDRHRCRSLTVPHSVLLFHLLRP
jgi:hypothetical protein